MSFVARVVRRRLWLTWLCLLFAAPAAWAGRSVGANVDVDGWCGRVGLVATDTSTRLQTWTGPHATTTPPAIAEASAGSVTAADTDGDGPAPVVLVRSPHAHHLAVAATRPPPCDDDAPASSRVLGSLAPRPPPA